MMLSLCEFSVPLRAEFMKSHVDKPGEPGHTPKPQNPNLYELVGIEMYLSHSRRDIEDADNTIATAHSKHISFVAEVN